jgi:dipeptidyl aminopeptidase/acylaminoacyl peptidase
MSRILILLMLSVGYVSCAQDGNLLIRQDLVDDLSEYPVYSNITETVDGKVQWKPFYRYLDSIDIYNITYMSDGLKINGFMVRPKEAGLYPCIIFNRGGSRDLGALTVGSAIHTLGHVAKSGYIVIASQYRGNAGSQGKEEFGGSDINDVTILPEVLSEVEGADTDRIGMYGWSRGGMMTYIALTEMDQIKAAAVGGAISDAYLSFKNRPAMEDLANELVPDFQKNREAELDRRSAIKFVDKFPKDVPILLLHGNSDWRVSSEHSLMLAMEFNKYRIPYRLIIFEGGDHGLSEFRPEIDDRVVRWFDRFVKNGEALPNMEFHGR